MGNDVAPEIGRGRIAVQEDDRVALPHVHVADLGVEHAHPPARMWIARRA